MFRMPPFEWYFGWAIYSSAKCSQKEMAAVPLLLRLQTLKIRSRLKGARRGTKREILRSLPQFFMRLCESAPPVCDQLKCFSREKHLRRRRAQFVRDENSRNALFENPIKAARVRGTRRNKNGRSYEFVNPSRSERSESSSYESKSIIIIIPRVVSVRFRRKWQIKRIECKLHASTDRRVLPCVVNEQESANPSIFSASWTTHPSMLY